MPQLGASVNFRIRASQPSLADHSDQAIAKTDLFFDHLREVVTEPDIRHINKHAVGSELRAEPTIQSVSLVAGVFSTIAYEDTRHGNGPARCVAGARFIHRTVGLERDSRSPAARGPHARSCDVQLGHR